METEGQISSSLSPEHESQTGSGSIRVNGEEDEEEDRVGKCDNDLDYIVPEENIHVFDIETDQSCEQNHEHQPVLLISKSMTGVEKVYFGYDCIEQFCIDLFSGSGSKVRKSEWYIAHFGSGFDFLPILHWLYEQQKCIPKIILRGNKVISLKVGNKRFIDSYLFIPIALQKFPKTFDIREKRKGYFPHYLTCKSSLSQPPEPPRHIGFTCKMPENCCFQTNYSEDCSHCVRKRNTLVIGGAVESSCNRTPNVNGAAPSSFTCGDHSETFEFKPGQFPNFCLFGPNSMKGSEEFTKLKEWHNEQTARYRLENLTYDFQHELTEYCRSDVEVLRQGVMRFRSVIKVCGNIDPFHVACTAASACNYIFRQQFMLPNSIAILPLHGYRSLDKTSFPASQWLEWIESEERKKHPDWFLRLYRSGAISQSSNAGHGEQKIGPCKVDGLLIRTRSETLQFTEVYDATIYEFFGCYHHGCPVCFPNRDEFNKKHSMKMGDLYILSFQERCLWLNQQKENKTVFLTKDGYRYRVVAVESIWECQFKKLMCSQNIGRLENCINGASGGRSISALRYVVSKTECYSPLKARDAFVGGRTENFVSHWHKSCNSQSFKYVDVCSLYPYVNSFCQYPVGHPDKILVAPVFANFSDSPLSMEKRLLVPREDDCIYCLQYSEVETRVLSSEYFGLIKCLVLPPRDLLLPVLPYKYNSKLFFPLCRMCVELKSSGVTQDQHLCSHGNYFERSFWGTFVSVELALALTKGYRILDVVEIWSWNKDKRSKNLFRDYISTFLKMKTEASGWPLCSWDEDDDGKNDLCSHRINFLRDYELKEGIKLDPDNIAKNEGLRFISKKLLNSFWGYLGMRENLPKTRFVNTYADIVKLFTSNTTRVLDAALVGDDLMFLQYQMIDDEADIPRKSNVVLAAFTTAHARIHLYKNFLKVRDPKNILYCDTDSIMYVQDTRESATAPPDIETGNYLGDMTDELPADVDVMDFFSGGPKFYLVSGRYISTGRNRIFLK